MSVTSGLLKFIEHRVADNRVLRLIQKWLKAGVSEEGEWSETTVGTPQGAVITPLTQKVTSSSNAWSRAGEQSILCLTFALRSNMFMTYGAIDQSGEGSAAECSSRPASSVNIAMPEAAQRLSRKFDLSERQAYRYLEEASELDRPVEVAEATVPITLKLPPSTVERLRKYAQKQWPDHWSDRDTPR